jgi:hypothetical protein
MVEPESVRSACSQGLSDGGSSQRRRSAARGGAIRDPDRRGRGGRIDAVLVDLTLIAPRSGRVQYLIHRAGEVADAGTRDTYTDLLTSLEIERDARKLPDEALPNEATTGVMTR